MVNKNIKETQTEKNVLTETLVDKLSLGDISRMTVSDPNCPDRKFSLPEVISTCTIQQKPSKDVAKRISTIHYTKEGKEYVANEIKTKEAIINKYYDLTSDVQDTHLYQMIGIEKVS